MGRSAGDPVPANARAWEIRAHATASLGAPAYASPRMNELPEHQPSIAWFV